MKKLFTILVIASIGCGIYSQAPQKMSYQAVIRNSSGNLVTNHGVGVKITILEGSPTGSVVYQEVFNPNPETNANGLISIEIGTGLPVSGTFAAINWATGPYYLKSEVDPAGATSYSIVGTSQILSVPYALYSKSVENIPDNSVTSAKITDGSISAADLGTGSVTGAKIADLTITNSDIANDGVTYTKISGSGAAANHVLLYTGSDVLWNYAPGSEIKYGVINIGGTTAINITTTYAKQATIGTFSKLIASSRLEITFNGRIYVESLTGTAAYVAYFELRVDDNPPSAGGRTNIKYSETGGNGIQVSTTGIFTGLSSGSHTISIWIRTSSGTGTDAMINPGNSTSDHVIIKEIVN